MCIRDSSETWSVAPAPLDGILYYASYGIGFAANSASAVGGDGMFGGVTLSIRPGDSGAKLVAGTDGGAASCRVCHSVASSGSRLVVQHGDNRANSSAYD